VSRFQVTCWCSSYKFPHRLGGGSCDGGSWAKFIRETLSSEECITCNCGQDGNGCDVQDGREDVKHCEYFMGLTHSGVWTNYPKTEEQIYQEEVERNYESNRI